MRSRIAFLALLTISGIAAAQDKKPDILIFTNGDQLTGKLERMAGGSVVFKSDMAGELTIPADKVKELKSSAAFVAIKKNPVKKPETTTGQIEVAAGNVIVTPPTGAPATIATKDLGFLIDQPTYDKELAHKAGLFQNWAGLVTGGATLVRSTQTSTTLTAGVALVRAEPTVPYLPARNKTIVDLTETYGKQTTPAIPPTVPATPDTVVLTSIFHADAERDEYFSPKAYALIDTSFDHNFSQGLSLQQVYGAGAGWTAVKSSRQELDVKADVHFEEQTFIATAGVTPSPNVRLFGSTFTENYMRQLPRKIVFTEVGTYLPAWTTLNAYSANITGTLTLPVWKRLNATISTTDNYLNDPAQFYKKNSYQFVTGVSYSLK